MKPEDKQLLLQVLCARLPYGVKCQFEDTIRIIDGESSSFYDYVLSAHHLELFIRHNNFYIKPYLRPMSSMTDEEKEEFKNKFKGFFQYFNGSIISDSRIYDRNEAVFVGEESCGELIDWLNKKMFDFRRLIPKDLALSTDKFDPYKK